MKLFYKSLLNFKKIQFIATVFPGFLRKPFLTLLWIIPTIALSAFVVEKVSREMNPVPPAKPEMVKVPIEVIGSDEKAKIVYIELEAQNIPEPSTLLLVPVSVLALLRRRR